MTEGKYDRWLKNAESWVHEDDWDPTEYFKWVSRLKEAKANLEEKFRSVDNGLVEEATKLGKKHQRLIRDGEDGKGGKKGNAQIVPDHLAKLVVRYIVAYHFLVRATYEEVPDKALVVRVQQHLVGLGIGMLDVDIAHMLQCAADKVPLKDAVRNMLANLVASTKESSPVETEYDNLLFPETPRFIQLLNETRVNWGPPNRAELARIFKQMKSERDPEKSPWNEYMLKRLLKTFDTDKKLELFLRRRGEPMFKGFVNDDDEIMAVEDMMACGDLDILLGTAEAREKESCSWEATVGPAVKAIKRLGRTSAGKDYENLARYARTLQKLQF